MDEDPHGEKYIAIDVFQIKYIKAIIDPHSSAVR